MAQDSSKVVKVVIIVLCFAGAAVGLYFAFAPTGGPTTPEVAEQPQTPEERGMGNATEEQIRESTLGG